MEILELYDNQIGEIAPNAFEHLCNLKQLSLMVNRVKKLRSNSFRGLKNLKSLSLSFNEIEEIDQNAFVDLSSLVRVELDNNKLTEIDFGCLEVLKPTIELIKLGGNNFNSEIVSYLKPTSDYLNENADLDEYITNWDKFSEQFQNEQFVYSL